MGTTALASSVQTSKPMHPDPRGPHPTLGELVDVVDELASSREETIAVLEHLFRSGRVRLWRLGQARAVTPAFRDGRVVHGEP